MQKKLGLVITDGVGFRNFILSNFLNEAKSTFDEVVIYSCLDKEVYKGFTTNEKIVELEVFKENFFTWFFMKLKEVAHLQLNKKKSFGILDSYNINKTFSKTNRGIAKRVIYFITKFLKSEFWIQRFNYFQKITFRNHRITKDYIKYLKKDDVDFLFFTHQRPPYIAPLIYATEQLNIKNATFIFSWDNLASKGRMAGNFNHYFVWSDLMKTELLEFYANVKTNQVHVVGTPQFEPYVYDEYGYEKETFYNKFNLDKNLKAIFFTCNDSSSENDPIYLKSLVEFIKHNKLVEDVNLIVRTSPAENPERFESLAKEYNFIKWNYPDWKTKRHNHQESWSQRVPSLEDLNDLKMLLKHCDICINVLSTITLDAFVFNKPVINPVFGNQSNNLYDDQKFLEYEHLKNLVNSQASIIAKNETEYLEAINYLLEGKDDKSLKRAKFLDLQIGNTLQGTCQGIVNTINKCIN